MQRRTFVLVQGPELDSPPTEAPQVVDGTGSRTGRSVLDLPPDNTIMLSTTSS